ncbi:hypothetical protein ACJRO7_017815 [Eucalyptus globulus]|uniref:Pectinesterase inhibitor domain-containing protein n=1 Tax=Eucalyptus globulus TaxID=34317 RepID=A0ABD3KRG8_EUCGL
MATSSALLFCNLAFVILLASIAAQSPHIAATDSRLVNRVCKQTPDYKFCGSTSASKQPTAFCITSLCSDPHAPDADDYTSAHITFGPSEHQYIQQRRNDYEKVALKCEKALGDLDLQSFFGSADLAMIAGKGTNNCKSAFRRSPSSMSDNNRDLKGFSKTCVAMANLFAMQD